MAINRRVSPWRKFNASFWLLPAWFAPHYKLRVFFHRLRGVKIGKSVFIGYYCTLDNVHPEMITLEDYSFVGANSVIISHDDYGPAAMDTEESSLRPVVVKRGAGIGIGSFVAPGVTIGVRSVVGAYSYVDKDVPDCTLCVLPRKKFKVLLPARRDMVSSDGFTLKKQN